MNIKVTIEQFYKTDKLRDPLFLESFLHKDFVMEWESSKGFHVLSKLDILKLSAELKQNYELSFFEIKYLFSEDNKVVVSYYHNVSTIENPDDIFLIAKAIIIWEFIDEKPIFAYLISKPE